jgi:hypothetical protein
VHRTTQEAMRIAEEREREKVERQIKRFVFDFTFNSNSLIFREKNIDEKLKNYSES